jgi:hypothetical protein
MYWRSDKSGLSDSSGFSVIPAFWSFQLSGHYSFLVITAVKLYRHSGYSTVDPVTENKKRNLKEKRIKQVDCLLSIVKEIA